MLENVENPAGPYEVSPHNAFSDPTIVARYPDGVRQFVPGVDALHRMAGVLLAERAQRDARILVLGAGGGLELKALAEAQTAWTFVGVDPSTEMLKLAARELGPLAARVELIEGFVDSAPEGPFDGAVCLLTLHFLEPFERRRTVEQIRRRLRPGAPFVAAHHTLPQEPVERSLWLSRYAAFAMASGADPEQSEQRRVGIDAWPGMLPAEHDEEILRAAGYSDLSLFYAAFSWRGWVGYA
jgi:tRNA (cmo5U34)-methyltransferase